MTKSTASDSSHSRDYKKKGTKRTSSECKRRKEFSDTHLHLLSREELFGIVIMNMLSIDCVHSHGLSPCRTTDTSATGTMNSIASECLEVQIRNSHSVRSTFFFQHNLEIKLETNQWRNAYFMNY